MLWLYITLAVIGVFLFFFLFPTLIMSGVLYTILLVRNKKEKWGRECSIPDDEEYRRMFDTGMAWEKRYSDKKREVSITSDGLKLCGEYFDFGGRRAVIIIAGRMESLLYSYYFAEPFREAGLNVLVIDNRAHGNSEGKVSSLGYKEYRDVIRWCRLLHDELGNERITLHGICIGASTALFTETSPDCPEYVDSIIVEGMYVNFYESFKNHMIVDRPEKPRFPIMQGVMIHIRFFSGANVVTDGPLKRIDRLKRPILFLHSREDKYSTPDKAVLLFDKCRSEKKLVWFDKGAHSRIRINNTEAYDNAIKRYLDGLN